jgi:hypothetical protein
MSVKNILDYWIDVEANTPPSILVGQHYMKENNVYNQLVTSHTSQMNWEIRKDMKHQVYMGIVPIDVIMSKWANKKFTSNNQYHSCLMSFEVDENGFPQIQTFKMPQYIIAMVHEHYGEDIKFGSHSDFFKNIKEQFSAWINILKTKNRPVTPQDLEKFLQVLLGFMEIWDWNLDLENVAYVESVTPSMRFPSDYMGSFIVMDLLKVKNFMVDNFLTDTSLNSYLNENHEKLQRVDVSKDIKNMKYVLDPVNHNLSAWPDSGAYPLVTAQQISMNLLFKEYYHANRAGVFSINGPPGTGKTTLIKSVIANIIFLRACEIVKLNNVGAKAFNKISSIKVDNEMLDIYEPVKELQGFEMIIASSNNNAVKNITEELPLEDGLNERSRKDFDYFKSVSDELLGKGTWGQIATALGNKKNNDTVMNSFSKQEANLIQEITELQSTGMKEILKSFRSNVSHMSQLHAKFKTNDFEESQKEFFKESIVSDKFWSQDIEEIHKSSPWNEKSVNLMKGNIFIDSLRVQKELIAQNKDIFTDNLKLLSQVLQGRIKDPKLIRAIWKTYFIICPVVSTTFSSLGRVFAGLGGGDVGWMFVDEAGQSKPQELVGGLWRAKLSCIIGDPLQVTPVNTITPEVNEFMRTRHGVSTDWDTLGYSGQELADRVNVFGSFVNLDKNNRIWLGSPLRVHRRCDSPMFEISNKIAYGNTMIHANTGHVPGEIASIIGRSAWFDIKPENANFEGYWVKEQYEFFKQKLNLILENQQEMQFPSLYVISPYRDVALKTIQNLLSEIDEWMPSDYSFSKKDIANWLYTSIGTIHTFQGKEAEVVFIMLGGNPKRNVAWAVDEPNIINVASTRAKNAQYILGDKELWNNGVLKEAIPILDYFTQEGA